MIAMRPVTIAGPDAQRHGRGNAGVAWLDLGLAMLIAQILYIELLPEWQRVGVHRADQFGTGPPRTSSFSSIGLIYRGRTIEPAACRAVMSGDEIDRCGTFTKRRGRTHQPSTAVDGTDLSPGRPQSARQNQDARLQRKEVQYEVR
jgi:hypothetical protein